MALFLLFDFAAEAVEVRAGGVEHGSVGLNFAFDFFEQVAEIADAFGAGGEQREALGGGGEVRSGVGGAVEEGDEIEDFARFEGGAFDMQLAYGGGAPSTHRAKSTSPSVSSAVVPVSAKTESSGFRCRPARPAPW